MAQAIKLRNANFKGTLYFVQEVVLNVSLKFVL
jgi:hypothetical protein